MILSKLHLRNDQKLNARSLMIHEVSHNQAKSFLDAHHVQGAVHGVTSFGLFWEGALVALAAFRKRNDRTYELVRYATSATVRGGHSRLVAYAQRKWDCDLITFADLSVRDGLLYETTGLD